MRNLIAVLLTIGMLYTAQGQTMSQVKQMLQKKGKIVHVTNTKYTNKLEVRNGNQTKFWYFKNNQLSSFGVSSNYATKEKARYEYKKLFLSMIEDWGMPLDMQAAKDDTSFAGDNESFARWNQGRMNCYPENLYESPDYWTVIIEQKK